MLHRLLHRKDDPLRYLRVPAKDRVDHDDDPDANAVDDITGDDSDFDRDAVRERGGIVPFEMLQ